MPTATAGELAKAQLGAPQSCSLLSRTVGRCRRVSPCHETLLPLWMPFRPRLPLRLLLPHLRRRPPFALSHLRRLLFSSHAATATEFEEDTVIGRDAPLAPPRVGFSGGVAGFGWEVGHDKTELDRKALIAEHFRICHELLWQRRWREMRGCLAKLVSEQGSDSAPTLCDILWNGFREWDLNSTVWDALANSYIRCQMIHDALYILNQMNSLNMQTILEYCEAQNIEKAFEIHDKMIYRGLNATPVTYNLLINALCSKGLVIHAENLLEYLRETDTKLRKFAYTTLIKAQCAKGMPYKAIEWIGKLINTDFEASIEDFSAAINRLCKRDYAEEAFMFIRIMISVGVYPDIQLYLVLGAALRKRNKVFCLPILQAVAIKTGI